MHSWRLLPVFASIFIVICISPLIHILCLIRTFTLLIHFLDGLLIALHGSKGRKLSRTLPHRHLRMPLRHMMWQVDNIVIFSHTTAKVNQRCPITRYTPTILTIFYVPTYSNPRTISGVAISFVIAHTKPCIVHKNYVSRSTLKIIKKVSDIL